MAKKKIKNGGAYVVTVDMGYGHQRAVQPLHDIAACPEGLKTDGCNLITANTYPGIPSKDRRIWEGGRSLYEKISRAKRLPLVGPLLFGAMDRLQEIEPFYPNRDLSAPGMQTKQIYRMIRKGWGKDLIETLNKQPLPYITSFFTTAFFAQEHGYKGDIYCICTDTDISRAWAPLEPKKSRIMYCAPNRRVKQRLMRYGVRKENIFVTGFPLPKENIGDRTNNTVLKESLGCRLSHLDPQGRYRTKYEKTIQQFLGIQYCKRELAHPLTITFAVGGAGAQREIGATIMNSLKAHIRKGEIRLNLVAGVRRDVYTFFKDAVKKCGLSHAPRAQVSIIYAESKNDYFLKFNEALLTTDILWTKPSELSFYAGLGLPVIMAPTIGSQEEFNRAWLHSIGAGVEQEDPRYTHEWLFDWLNSGWLAEAAMEGYLDAPRNGAYHIEDLAIRGIKSEIEDMHLM